MSLRLSQKQIKELKSGMNRVEAGLYIYSSDNKRSWFYLFSFEGKQRKMGLGSAYDVPYSVAKDLKNQAQAILLTGRNPIEVRKDEKKKAVASTSKEENKPLLLKDFYVEAIERLAQLKQWKKNYTKDRYIRIIRKYVIPIIGDKPLLEINRDDVLKALKPSWDKRNNTSAQALNTLRQILNLAYADAGVEKFNPTTWKGNLEYYLIFRKKGDIVHYASIPHEKLKSCIHRFDLHKSTNLVILFIILTATRKAEATEALWSEIDWENNIWSVPPERRKDGKKEPFRVPLSTQAVSLLKALPRLSPFIFAGRDLNRAICRNTVNTNLRWLFSDMHITVHGMRSTFRNWCAEREVDFTVAEKMPNAFCWQPSKSSLFED